MPIQLLFYRSSVRSVCRSPDDLLYTATTRTSTALALAVCRGALLGPSWSRVWRYQGGWRPPGSHQATDFEFFLNIDTIGRAQLASGPDSYAGERPETREAQTGDPDYPARK